MATFSFVCCLISLYGIAVTIGLSENAEIESLRSRLGKRSYDGLLDRLVDVLVKERSEKYQLSGKLNQVKKELDTVIREVRHLQRQKNQKEFNYRKMEKDVAKTKSDIMNMKIKMMDFPTKENVSISRIQFQSKMVQKIKSALKKIGTNRKAIDNLGRLVASKKTSSNRNVRVGFTYRLHKSKIFNYNANSKIHFYLKIADYGGGYNMSDGIFYCQHGGLYMFAVSITTSTNNIWVFIMKNGKQVGYAYGNKSTSWDSLSGTAVVALKLGDRVWMQTDAGAHINHWSVFTGARISD